MMMALELPGLVFAYYFDTAGVAHRLPDEGVGAALDRPDGWCWVHLNLADQRARHWVEAESRLDDETRAVLLSDDSHPRLEALDQALIGVLPDLHHEAVPEEEHRVDHNELVFGRLHFVMSRRCIISGRFHPLHSAERVRRRLSAGQRLQAPEDLIEALVYRFASVAGVVTTSMAALLDDIEDQVLDDAPEDERRERGRLAPLRRGAVALRRQVSPLRSMFSNLAELEPDEESDWHEATREAAARIAQRLDVLSHDIVAIQERARLLNDQIAMDMAEQTNRHLYLLSVLSALLLPPTLVAGIFGMNTSNLPWTDGEGGSWWAMSLAATSALVAFVALARLGVARRAKS